MNLSTNFKYFMKKLLYNVYVSVYACVCVSVFEVGWCECGWLVLWGAGFSVFNSKWEMNSVFELGECF